MYSTCTCTPSNHQPLPSLPLSQVFDCTPLCALIQEKIFVVHGGLFSREGVSLDHIRGISRKREPPVHSEVFEVRGSSDAV